MTSTAALQGRSIEFAILARRFAINKARGRVCLLPLLNSIRDNGVTYMLSVIMKMLCPF